LHYLFEAPRLIVDVVQNGVVKVMRVHVNRIWRESFFLRSDVDAVTSIAATLRAEFFPSHAAALHCSAMALSIPEKNQLRSRHRTGSGYQSELRQRYAND
jgi:hypothetical protein